MDDHLEVRIKYPVDDEVLTALHTRAFGSAPAGIEPWAERLGRHSVSWISVFDADRLVGFVHACWDGGAHAFLLDTIVDPAYRRRGVGLTLVSALRAEVAAAGCEWLHVDYESHLATFYAECGFRPTAAGLMHLT